jgi:hypothetical protein
MRYPVPASRPPATSSYGVVIGPLGYRYCRKLLGIFQLRAVHLPSLENKPYVQHPVVADPAPVGPPALIPP